jgi:hypothetical protein
MPVPVVPGGRRHKQVTFLLAKASSIPRTVAKSEEVSQIVSFLRIMVDRGMSLRFDLAFWFLEPATEVEQ